MNQTNTVMLAILVALATTTGLVTALSSVATPAHAKVNQGECPGTFSFSSWQISTNERTGLISGILLFSF
jgi:hypothetical protein